MPGLPFCMRCGARLERAALVHGDLERLVCGACGRIQYENSKPCAGVVVVRNGCVLLAQRAIEPRRGWWDIPGGFLESGEHPADGARREAREELGIDVRLGPQLGIFMDRYETEDGWDHTLNVYYLVQSFEGEPRPDDDVEALSWFQPHELPSDLAFPHLEQVLAAWRAGMNEEMGEV